MTDVAQNGASAPAGAHEESPYRPKRRANKPVDYTEKKEDEFEVSQPGATTKQQNKATNKQDGRKRHKASSEQPVRSESPQSEDNTVESAMLNYQPQVQHAQFSHMLNLDGAVVKNSVELVLKDGSKLCKNDNIYLICEPPGEPYYIGRIMGFAKKTSKKHHQSSEEPMGDVEAVEPANLYVFKINWWYRCRDISKHSTDSRLLYASMHSDTCPLQSYRGKCSVKHKDELEDLEAYKLIPNNFWFEKLFDRYMIKFYDVLPTADLISLPPNYLNALTKRFQYIFVEQGKSKDMLQSPKSCVKCNQWSTPADSIECCECSAWYHMLCLDPPLYKKPARGFAWSCIKCTKSLESKKMIPSHEMEKTNSVDENNAHVSHEPLSLPLYEELAIAFLEKDKHLSQLDRRNKEEWIYRYLGMHAKLEDALDLQDRPYPRAASRLGPKNQLTGVQDWFGHKVEYYDYSSLDPEFQTPSMFKKKKPDKRKKKASHSQEEDTPQRELPLPEEFKNQSPEDFPPWLQPRPKGYIERGGDDTVTLMWKNPEDESLEPKIDQYVKDCAPIADKLRLFASTPNFIDAILKFLLDANYDIDKAFEQVQTLDRAKLREPTFTGTEIRKFENGIKKYGSELWPTFKEVKTQSFAMIVRFYYLWKKTKQGHLIWDNYEGRKKYKAQQPEQNEDEDIGHDADDSSYDASKLSKKVFQCKHCKTFESMQWFRISGQQNSEEDTSVLHALCYRCARLWRRYAVVWEDPNEVLRKVGQKGGNGWKKKVEQELVEDAELILQYQEEIGTESKKSRKSSSVQLNSQVKSTSDVKPEETKGKRSYKKKNSTSVVNGDSSLDSPTPTSTPSKAKSKNHQSQEESKPEMVIPSVWNDVSTINFNQKKSVELYYYTSSSLHNPRPKFKDSISQVTQSNKYAFPKLLKPQPVHDHCGVCLEVCDPEQTLICYGCGLYLHAHCYGIHYDDPNQLNSKLKWYCDPCSNKLNPVVQNDYTCVICQEGNEAVKGGMKRTFESQWVHVLCALFAEDVQFDDVDSLQPVIGLQSYMARKFKNGNMDPSVLKCDKCVKDVKIEEVMNSNGEYKIGFTLNVDFKPDSKSVKIGNSFGKLKPTMICRIHETEYPDFIGFEAQIKRYKQSGTSPAIKVFLEDQKKIVLTCSGAQLQYQSYRRAFDDLKGLQSKAEESTSNGSSVDKCSLCSRTKTLKWITKNDDKLCYSCWQERYRHEADNNDDDSDEEMRDAYTEYQTVFGEHDFSLRASNYGLKDAYDKIPDEDLDWIRKGKEEEEEEVKPVVPLLMNNEHEDPSTDVETTPQLKQEPQFETSGGLPPLRTFTNDPLPMKATFQHHVDSAKAQSATSDGEQITENAPRPQLPPLSNLSLTNDVSSQEQPTLGPQSETKKSPISLLMGNASSTTSSSPSSVNNPLPPHILPSQNGNIEKVELVRASTEATESSPNQGKMSIGSILG